MVLAIDNLAVSFGHLRAVDGISLAVAAGETLAIVGESGSGKSVTALATMGLLPPSARTSGSIALDGTPLTPTLQQDLRGNAMAMIFQEPMTSLNPAFTAGEQIAEALRIHRRLPAREAASAAIAMLDRVRIPDAARRARQYPHEFSGGQRQRVMIAIALACSPRLLLADEPTTALDVTVQAQILTLLETLKRETGTAVVLITHDLGIVADHADQVAVMYAGRIVERAPTRALFANPEHPYTIGLLGAVPRLTGHTARLATIPGAVPDMRNPPAGCRFAPRCPFALARCFAESPPLLPMAPQHASACWRAPLSQLLEAA